MLNIATGIPETLLNLVDYVGEAGGKAVECRFEPARSGDIKASYADVEKAAKSLILLQVFI